LFGPAVTSVRGIPLIAWADAANGELKMMKGTNGSVVSTGETCSAAPALTFIPEFADSPVFVAWTGTNAQRTLNVAFSDFGNIPNTKQKVTLPDSGPTAATSISGPSLAFKAGHQAALLIMGWAGLLGGPDHDNHLNVISSDPFVFGDRQTFLPVTSVGPAVLDITRSADDKVFFAWVDKQSQRIMTASSHTDDLPTIPA
jgi:hypothetical protein